MKIALIIGSLTIKGGGQRQILQLGENLQKKGWEIAIFTADLNQEKCYPDLCKKLLIRSLSKDKKKRPNQSSRFPFKSQITNLLNILKIAYMVYKYDPDILNPHEWPANWIACLAKLLRKSRVKIVWMCNDLWHQYNPYQKQAWWLGAVNFPTRLVDRFITRHFVDEIVVLDNRIKRLVKKFYNREAVVIRSGLDVKKLASFKPSKAKNEAIRQKFGIRPNEFLLLSLGVFFPQRRFEDAIWAIKKIVNDYNVEPRGGTLYRAESSGTRIGLPLKYIIIGSKQANPVYFKHIQSLIKANRLEKTVKIVGKPVSESELPAYYSACDVFIFPNDKQTWGLAVIEAMALGKSCVVSKGAGVHEVLTDSHNALLVKPRNPSDLAGKLTKLLSNKDLRKRIGKNGKDFVFSTFSWEKYTSKMIEIFSKAKND